jgi:hypothetical protein
MHAKTPICFNFFNFHPVSSKFSMNIEHIILTNRMFFVLGVKILLTSSVGGRGDFKWNGPKRASKINLKFVGS